MGLDRSFNQCAAHAEAARRVVLLAIAGPPVFALEDRCH